MTLYQTLPLLQGTFSTVLFIIATKQQPRNAATGCFLLFLTGIAFWGFSVGMMRLSSAPEQAIWWERGALTMIGLTSASYFFFVRRYAKVGRPIGGLVGSLFLFATAALAPTDLLVKGMRVDEFGNAPAWGPAFPVWVLFNYALVINSIVHLERARRASASYEVRNRYLHFILGGSITLAGAATDAISATGVPIYPMGIPANMVFSCLTAIAIFKYHLLDIRVTLRSSVIYVLSSSLLAGPLVLVPTFVVWKLYTLGVSGWLLLASMPVLAMVLHPIYRRWQELLQRRFYGQRYDHLRALERFSELSRGTTEMNELCSLIVGWAGWSLQPEFTYLLIASGQGEFSVAASTGIGSAREIRIGADNPLALELKRSQGPVWRQDLDVFPTLQAMRAVEREALDSLAAELYSPIASEEQLIGILALGPKQAGQVYTREDLQTLATLSRQAFLNLENVRLLKMERERVFHLEKLEQMKSDFLLAVSHQLKTPLTSVKVSAGILADAKSEMPAEVRANLAGEISRGVRDLETQIATILDFAKMENASLELNREPSDIKEIINEAVNIVAPQFRLKKQTVQLDSGGPISTTAMVDPDRIRQVLTNLLSNANKFTPRGGYVRVRLRRDKDNLFLEVRDDGIGIAPEEQEKIFQPYYQVKDKKEKAPTGTGLGLAIAKGLVELHLGRIWVESKPGEGAAFFVSLPITEEGE